MRPKRPRDMNELAKAIAEEAVSGHSEMPVFEESETVQRARKGGLRGGRARAEALSPEERQKIAKTAAKARWNKIK